MQYRKLGKTGWDVGEISFGAWALGGQWGDQRDSDSLKALHTAVERGVNFIDTAVRYGNGRSEQVIGKFLKETDKRIYVATKTPPTPLPWPPTPYCNIDERYNEKWVREQVETSLRNLDIECIDLLQLHTWTRTWNTNPRVFDILKKLQDEGKIQHVGVSTPEHDQNGVIGLIRGGYVDTVQVIYNIFEQEPAAELLPAAQEHNVGIIVRVALDEGSLTGKFSQDSSFPDSDFRTRYFSGDRLSRTVKRVEKLKEDVEGCSLEMYQIALKFALSHPAVSTVIAGMRNVEQATANTAVSDLPSLDDSLVEKLHGHLWRKGFWYQG